jgi:hypothetical protein
MEQNIKKNHTYQASMFLDVFESNAIFSEDRSLRFALQRMWEPTKDYVMFIGLNPSTANEETNDPTIRRVIGFAKKWGYGGVVMANCFPFVSTDPMDLKHIGVAENDMWLETLGATAGLVVFAWGSFQIVKERKRDLQLSEMFPEAVALAINSDGSPRHPLYVPYDITPVKYVALARHSNG